MFSIGTVLNCHLCMFANCDIKLNGTESWLKDMCICSIHEVV